MKDLQAIINDRADRKLEQKLDDRPFIATNLTFGELMELTEPLKKSIIPDDWSINSILTCRVVKNFMRKKLIEGFRESEAEVFVKEVEELKSKVSDLNEEINNLNCQN
jgi:hypothetical protein